MASAEKISVSLDRELAKWARKRAKSMGTTLSEVIAGRLELERRMEKLDRLLTSMNREFGGLDEQQLELARRELVGGVAIEPATAPSRKRKSTR